MFSRNVQTVSVLCSQGRYRLYQSCVLQAGTDYQSCILQAGTDYQSCVLQAGTDYQSYVLQAGTDYQSCVLQAGTDYISPVFSRKVQTVESCVLIEVHHDCVVVWITHLRLLNTSLQRCVMTVSWSGSPTSGH